MKWETFEKLMEDWVIPIAIMAAVIWLVIWLAGGSHKAQETAPEATEEPVIVQMRG